MESTKDLLKQIPVDLGLFYEAMIQSTDDYIYIVDMKTNLSLVSENMLVDFCLPGRIVDDLVLVWGSLIHEKDQQRYQNSIEIMLCGETSEHNVEYQIRNRKNEYVWVLCRGKLQRDANNVPLLFAGVVTNLNSRGRVDYTTGLFTHHECERKINLLLETNKTKCALLLLGLDDFSRINNLYKHTFGDLVLRQYAQDIQRMLPEQATIYRFDGDEFAIVIENTKPEEITELFHTIQAYGNQEQSLENIRYYCTLSAGISFLHQDGDSYSSLVRSASRALEISKKSGKNSCTFFTEGSLSSTLRNMELSAQLQSCVLNNMENFSLAYQPLTDGATKAIYGCEALLRWKDSDGKPVTPDEFIPLLEGTGLILSVGKWVLENTLEQCKKWSMFIPDFIMNVNVSYLQLQDASFIDYVSQALKDHQCQAQHLVLEMTESYFVTNLDLLHKSFHQLREMGIRLAMDDFGTGYSSLGMLSQIPADIVKIDRMFIAAIDDQNHNFNRSFIEAVIQLCHSVNISVCIEGVERQEEMDTVLHLQADTIQGFLISKPLPAESFETTFLLKQ